MSKKRMTLYATYGILGHEKLPIYSADGPCGEIYDKIKVIMPYKLLRSRFGEILIDLNQNGRPYLLREVLKTDKTGRPILAWRYGDETFSRKLKIIE